MRYVLIGIVWFASLLQAGIPVFASEHAAKALKDTSPNMFASKAQCVQQILAYRGAISHLSRSLSKSPEAITYTSTTGRKITVENRFRKQVQYNQNVLNAGLSAKLVQCGSEHG